MSNIKIEFPADRADIAIAIGQALTTIGQGRAITDNLTTAAALSARVEVMAGKEGATVAGGPFYWVNIEMGTYAICISQGELIGRINGDGGAQVSREEFEAFKEARTTGEREAASLIGETEGHPKTHTADQCATQEQPAAGARVAGDTENVDQKGVAFNGDYCSKAAIPFYGTGKKKGQWKKRQGVDEGDYDDWYADALFDGKIEDSEAAEESSEIAAEAFSKAAEVVADASAPQDAGQLMKWVSEQQTAGHVTQQQVTDAYTALKLPFDAIMNPAYPIAENCAAIYNHLKGDA